MEFTAASPETGKCRVIVREEWPTELDGEPSGDAVSSRTSKRFIWTSERTGWQNFYLYDLSGKLLATLTNHTTFEVGSDRARGRGDRAALLHGARRRQLT